ncbi:MAG: tail fiber protein [Magnetococcales bacterium]|nr:tail fiber protein [Magnetococcales bacterium]
MSDYFLGEIRIFSFSFAPVDWALCNGASLPQAQNQALFSLLGTRYNNSQTKTGYFGLPNFIGRTPVGVGTAASGTVYNDGVAGGAQNVTLTTSTMPPHTHNMVGTTNNATKSNPTNNMLADSRPTTAGVTDEPTYVTVTNNLVQLSPPALLSTPPQIRAITICNPVWC